MQCTSCIPTLPATNSIKSGHLSHHRVSFYWIIVIVYIQLQLSCIDCLALHFCCGFWYANLDISWYFLVADGQITSHRMCIYTGKTTVSISVRCIIPATKLKSDQFLMCAGFGRFRLLPNLTPNSDCIRFASGEKRLRQGKFKNPPGCWFLRRCPPQIFSHRVYKHQ